MHTTLDNHNTVVLHVEADSELITHMNQKQTGEKLTITHRSPKTVIRKQDRKENPTTRHQRRRPCRSIIYTHPTTNTKPQVEAENPGIVMVNDARVCSTASALTPGKAQRCSPRS